MRKIPEDIRQAARKITEGEDGWIGSVAGMDVVSRAILAERERGQLKLGQAYQVIADLLMESPRHDTEHVLDYFASDEFDPDFLPWPRQENKEETV